MGNSDSSWVGLAATCRVAAKSAVVDYFHVFKITEEARQYKLAYKSIS
jgi:hypothetical protein